MTPKAHWKKWQKPKMDNIYGDIKALQSAFDDVKINLVKKLQPSIRKFIQWLTSKMPAVDKAVGKAADFFIEKVGKMKKKIDAFTSTPKWENADFFGKISIAWDEIIAQPFSNWWNSTGNAWFAKKAGEIGNGIGEGLTAGLLALLGFSPQEAIGDGISIGASFAEGFAKGFDGKKVGEAIIEAIKNVVKDAGTVLPGGEEASSTSGLSAALVGFVGYKVARTGYGMYKGASSLFGKTGKGGIGSMVSEALAVSTMTVSAGVVNVYGNVLNNVGKVAGTAAVGDASIGGAVAGGAGIVSGLFDIYKGTQTEGKEAKDKYVQGGTKIGMVGTGAAVGAAIGTAIPIPVVGTATGALIGAGVGGIGAL